MDDPLDKLLPLALSDEEVERISAMLAFHKALEAYMDKAFPTTWKWEDVPMSGFYGHFVDSEAKDSRSP